MKDKDRVIEILKNNGVAHYWDIDKIASQICELDSELTPEDWDNVCDTEDYINEPPDEWVSDEEIEKNCPYFSPIMYDTWIDGAKWMRDKLTNK